MTLDPETTARIIEATADRIAAQIRAIYGNLAEFATVDLSTAAQCLGITRKQAGRILPTVKVSERLTSVRLSDLQAHLAKHATSPGN